jgi:hypothetical protein
MLPFSSMNSTPGISSVRRSRLQLKRNWFAGHLKPPKNGRLLFSFGASRLPEALTRSVLIHEFNSGFLKSSSYSGYRWSAVDLAVQSKVGVATIRRVEVLDGEIPVTDANIARAARIWAGDIFLLFTYTIYTILYILHQGLHSPSGAYQKGLWHEHHSQKPQFASPPLHRRL